MAIFSRVTRLLRADLHGVMDQLEDSELLLKQYLREMEAALAEKDARLHRKSERCSLLRQEHERYAEQMRGLDDDITAAVSKSKDDIARMLIRKLKQIRGHRDGIASRISELDQEIERLQASCNEQRLQLDRLKLKATAHFDMVSRQKWGNDFSLHELSPAGMDPSPEEVELELIKRKENLERAVNQGAQSGGEPL